MLNEVISIKLISWRDSSFVHYTHQTSLCLNLMAGALRMLTDVCRWNWSN